MNMARVLVALFLMFTCSYGCKGSQPTFENFKHNSIIQNPKTKIDYYVESDRRHVVAISPNGAIVWCCEVIPAKWQGTAFITRISFGKKSGLSTGEDGIDVKVWRVGQGGGWINAQTGVYSDCGKTL
jgi:hypothetical protein